MLFGIETYKYLGHLGNLESLADRTLTIIPMTLGLYVGHVLVSFLALFAGPFRPLSSAVGPLGFDWRVVGLGEGLRGGLSGLLASRG
jgi:hypothetical protein